MIRTTYITILSLCVLVAAGVGCVGTTFAAETSTVLITELQTGSATASDEFIELTNTGSQPVDIAGWQVRYRNGLDSGETTQAVATVPADAPVLLAAGAIYLLHTATVALPVGTAGQLFAATLSVADKTVGLYRPLPQVCELQAVDAIAWGTSTGGEGTSLPVTAGAVQLAVARYVQPTGYVDTQNNAYDAIAAVVPGAVTTPGALNTQLLPQPPAVAGSAGATTLPSVPLPGCVPPTPVTPATPATPPPAAPLPSPPAVVAPPPADDPDDVSSIAPSTRPQQRNVGLYAPQLSELLPNPAKPQTDAHDEFVELYNPNATAFDLSGYRLATGLAGTRGHTFAEGTSLPAKSFVAFYARDTRLALSNAAGQVRLLDGDGSMVAQSEPYQDAKDGQAWLSADNAWQWTTIPSPSAINVVSAPIAKKGKVDGSTTSPKVTNQKTTGTVKGATASSTAEPQPKVAATQQSGAADEGWSPLHPGLLVATGVIAVSYGIYEYRRDLANRIHQFRANRSARAAARRIAAGRRGAGADQ